MDIYEMIKAQMGVTVPFAAHTGVQLDSVSDGAAVASLDQRDETANHLGAQHAGALFTLGEAASGAAMAGGFAEKIMEVQPVAGEAQIQYKKLAKGKIIAKAKTMTDASALRDRLTADGKVNFDVTVDLFDESEKNVASLTVKWFVRKKPKD